MATPQVVAEAIHAMQSAVNIPVTVKHRIGIDNQDSFEELCRFLSSPHNSHGFMTSSNQNHWLQL
jgi:tRNA-dihydrouridine synthase